VCHGCNNRARLCYFSPTKAMVAQDRGSSMSEKSMKNLGLKPFAPILDANRDGGSE
jgi:hypothetical protein